VAGTGGGEEVGGGGAGAGGSGGQEVLFGELEGGVEYGDL